jgi:hypothetical protein
MKTNRRFLTALALSTFLLCNPFNYGADVFGPPSTIDYQGRLLDSAGLVLAPDEAANFKVQFRLYDAPTGGTIVWAEEQIVTVLKGQFSVRLGEGTPIPTGVGGTNEGTVDHDAVGLPGAFNGKERYLGVKVVVPNQTNGEIQPRLAFLTSPFSYVAGSAQVAQSVNQPAGSPPSSLNIGSVSYANQPMTATGTVSATAHTVLVDSTAAAVAATLPAGTAALNRQLLIVKKDASTNPITVVPPGGGTINGTTNSVYLKARGESITIQNVGANDWWVVAESRDKTPVGTIIAYASNNVPVGYLPCNGTHLNRTDYPDLFAAIGVTWGNPSASTFRAPDLRGGFLRGRDGGRGLDEDRGSRYADYGGAGAGTGDNVGSYQGDLFRSHGHGVNDPGHGHPHNAGAGQGGYGIIRQSVSGENKTVASTDAGSSGSEPDLNAEVRGLSISSSQTGISIQASGGSETRPENYNVNYCIKY